MFSEQAGDETHKTEFAYDRDNRVTGSTYDGSSHKVNYTYDELGRVKIRTVECGEDTGKVTNIYTYVPGGYGVNSSTPLVWQIMQEKIGLEYEYDSRGNITSEKRGNLTTTYQYDALGQLIRVNDPHENATWVYNYDRGGNILSKVKYAYTTGTVGTAIETIPYDYGDSNWKDKLTSYNGQTITYDVIGNPTNDGTWTYTWQAGRQLKQMSAEGTSVSFKYDHNGMRVQKVVEQSWYPVITNYMIDEESVVHMTVDYTDYNETTHRDNLHFFYDDDSPAFVEYNGVKYTYVRNLQGDVMGLLDSSGTLVVEYKYDPWGSLLSITGSLAETLGKRNPFRYRGYVYDEETGLYYLKSRYYNSKTGRFINADLIENSEAENLLALNLFCYTLNSPINNSDPDGTFLFSLSIGAAVAAAKAVVAVAAKYVVPVVATAVVAVVVPLAVKAVQKAVKTVKAVYRVASEVISYAKQRSEERIGRRKRFKSRKEAKEAAKRAGRGKVRHDAQGHPPKVKSPHYHPDVPKVRSGQQTPHMPSSHDHYFYPKGR